MPSQVERERRRIIKQTHKAVRDRVKAMRQQVKSKDHTTDMAICFVEWAAEAEIKPTQLKRFRRYHNKPYLVGWMISDAEGKLWAITTDYRFLRGSYSEVPHEMLIYPPDAMIAKYTLTHAPHVPWIE